jgi:hypothetical protein
MLFSTFNKGELVVGAQEGAKNATSDAMARKAETRRTIIPSRAELVLTALWSQEKNGLISQ